MNDITEILLGARAQLPPVPDPCRPAYLHRYAHAGNAPRGKRWYSHQDRRSMILAAARKLLLEVGFDGICFSAIAGLCGISVPTIYNVVGNHRRVMQDASAEWVQWLALAARPQGAGAMAVLDILQAFWSSGPDYPEFTANAVKISASPEGPLNDAFNRAGHRVIRSLLAKLQVEETLRPMIDAETLAWHLTQSVHRGVCHWSFAPYDHARFRREFASGPGLMFLGAIRGPEVRSVEWALDAVAQGCSFAVQ